MRNNSKGFTLVELVTAMAIMSVVFLAVGAILISATVNNRDIENKTAVQQYSELVISEFRNSCTDASQILSLKNSSGIDLIDQTGQVDFDGELVIGKSIITNNLAFTSGAGDVEKRFFKLDKSSHIFSSKANETDAYSAVASRVESIKLSPLPKAANPADQLSFRDCTGIEVIVNVKIDDKSIRKKNETNITAQYYFKNTDYRK